MEICVTLSRQIYSRVEYLNEAMPNPAEITLKQMK